MEVPPEVLSVLTELELGELSTTTSAEGHALTDWVAGLIENDARWADVVDDPGPVPE